MGSESTSSSPCGKRSRDPEDEVYLDNLHSHKRYLSEIMASSLNGLTVGDSLSENLMESPARSETMCYPRDEVSLQYSPMSEDSDDARYYETLGNPTSPVSPHRHQKSLSGFPSTFPTSTNSYPSPSSTLTSVAGCQPRQRGSDSEGRFPSSPSDISHSADLRRAALLRSVQRSQPQGPPAFELPLFNTGQETMQNIEEGEDRPCSHAKSVVDEECSSSSFSESELCRDKFYGVSDLNVNREESGEEEVFGGTRLGRTGLVSPRRSVISRNFKACGAFK